MTKVVTLERILELGLDAILNPADTRRKAGQAVPDLVVEWLLRKPCSTERQAAYSRLATDIWRSLKSERGNRWDLGWAELAAGLALAIELLHGDPPEWATAELEGTPAKALLEKERIRFQRFVLVVDAKADARRVFVSSNGPSQDTGPIEDRLVWSVDGPPVRERSHTLMLALLSAGLLDNHLGPVAATGELADDGVQLRPVMGFIEKAAEWWRRYPEGLLVSSPVDELTSSDFAGLRRHLKTQQASVERNWVVAATMDEARAKLAPRETSVEGWDGSPLPPSARLQTAFNRPDWLQGLGDTPDVLLAAGARAFDSARNGTPPKGVLIEGRPGSGKSVLSRLLEARFARGQMGALGFGLRQTARSIAGHLQGAGPHVSWSSVLSEGHQELATLAQRLEESRRLVPIVDGLDELDPRQLALVLTWLQQGTGWWIATSRPGVASDRAKDSAWRLEIADLAPEDVKVLFNGLGRPDLAEANLGISHGEDRGNAVYEMTRTPLHVALLAKVVPAGDTKILSDVQELYEWAFDGLLTHASLSGRINADDAQLAKSLLAKVAGELALRWLLSGEHTVAQATLQEVLEQAGVGHEQHGRVLQALAFGHLLVPSGVGFDFAHRTMAEWAAAAALARRVRLKLESLRGEHPPHGLRSRRSRTELSELARFLEDPILPSQGRWTTLLRFYAPSIAEPLGFLDRLVGPGHVGAWHTSRPAWQGSNPKDDAEAETRPASASDLLGLWSFAFELLGHCRNWRPEDARVAWAVAARRWLMPVFQHLADEEMRSPDSLQHFTETIAGHLPHSLGELVNLAALTEVQARLLALEPERLLPAIPAARSGALYSLLETGSRSQQLAVLRWFRRNGVAVPSEYLEHFLSSLPGEVDKAIDARDAKLRQLAPEDFGSPRVDEESDVIALESAVWESCISAHFEPPWCLVRNRVYEWPSHLDEVLSTWFRNLPEQPSEFSSEHSPESRRREVLAAQLRTCVELEDQFDSIVAGCSDPSERKHLIDSVKRLVDCQHNDWELARVLEYLTRPTKRVPVSPAVSIPQGNDAPAEKALQKVRELEVMRRRTSKLCCSLNECAMEALVGRLWVLLHPGSAVRTEVLRCFDRHRYPRQIPALDILVHLGGANGFLQGVDWSTEHLDQLEDLVLRAHGATRLAALIALVAARSGDLASEIVKCLRTGDEEFQTLAREKLTQLRHTDWEAVKGDCAMLEAMPLAARASAGTPGWRNELLDQIISCAEADLSETVSLAVRHQVREALPLLAARLERATGGDRCIVEGVAALATEDDRESARVALRHALKKGWWPQGFQSGFGKCSRERDGSSVDPGVALARFLEEEDLELLEAGTLSALGHPSLAEAIRTLGPSATRRLVRTFEQSRGSSEAGPAAGSSSEHTDPTAPKDVQRRGANLAGTVLVIANGCVGSLNELVDLVFRTVSEDVHEVTSQPGPLGSDYDEPGDLDWHSRHVNEGVVKAAIRAIEDCLLKTPEHWLCLRQLFKHPSETLQLRAFELCADRAAPHGVAALGLEALECHLDNRVRTRWTGDTGRLALAAVQPGAGTCHVSPPQIGLELVAAVRKRLTPAHKEMICSLTTHRLPQLRILGARWAGELGTPDWISMLNPLVGDPLPKLAATALWAIASISPTGLDPVFRTLDAEAWTPFHFVLTFEILLHGPIGSPEFRWQSPRPEMLLRQLSVSSVARMLSLASNLETGETGTDQREERTLSSFNGLRGQAERIVEACPSSLDMSLVEMLFDWLTHRAPTIRLIARRQLAAQGRLPEAEVEKLLARSDPGEQVSGAECAIRMNLEHLAAPALAVVRAAARQQSPRHNAGSHSEAYRYPSPRGRRPPRPIEAKGELAKRILWALEGAGPEFAPVLPLVARTIPYDELQCCPTDEAEEIVAKVSRVLRSWGPSGAPPALRLMDRGELADDYAFLRVLGGIAEKHSVFATLVRKRAKQGHRVSSELAKALNKQEFESDLNTLAATLAKEVFPPGWPDAGTRR